MTDIRPSILAIDDTPANLMVLAQALSSEFDLQLAKSGASGLDIARRTRPQLILLDVMMPEMDGFETCRQFKADETLKDIPIVFITALTDEFSETQGLALGAVDYLTKPFKLAIARQRIINLLERERWHAEVMTQRDHLEQRVAERTREIACHMADLEVLRAITEQTSVAKNREVRDRAHQLRMPLHNILGVSQLLQRRLADSDHKSNLVHIDSAVSQMRQQLDELIDFVQAGGQGLEKVREAFSVETLISDLLADFTPRAQAKGLELSCLPVEGPPLGPLQGDMAALTRIIGTLIGNAIQYTEHGSVVLSFSVRSLVSQPVLRCEVSDTGVGMDEAVLRRIFQPEGGGSARNSPAVAHEGLGLTVCQQLATRLGGILTARSQPGVGSSFVLMVPVAEG